MYLPTVGIYGSTLMNVETPNLMIQASETFCGHTRSVYVQMRGMRLVFDLIEGHDGNISRNRIGHYKRVWVARPAHCEHWLGFVHDTTP